MKIQEDSWTGKVVLMAHPGESFSPVLCSAVAYGFRQNGLAAWWELNVTLNRDADLPWRKLSGGSSGFRARELCVLLPFCCIRSCMTVVTVYSHDPRRGT